MSDDDQRSDIVADEGGDDLFGDADEVDDVSLPDIDDLDDRPTRPSQQDEDLDDDVDDDDRPVKERTVQDFALFRHQTPRPRDGTLKSLRIPPFVRLMPAAYNADVDPSEWALENSKSLNPTQLVRWKRDASGKMRSNTNIYRWSDGSTTIMVGDEHFEIQQKELAPRPDKPYNVHRDNHYYMAAASVASNALITVGHIHEQYDVRPNKEMEDVAIQQLRAKMDAQRAALAQEDTIITTNVDPELQKKQAELAEKERNRAQRRRENAAAKIDGGLGVGGGRGRGGLTIGDLEGPRRSGGAGKRKGGSSGIKKKRRRNDAYDSDDDLSGGPRRANDYDKEDDFIAPSDDEGGDSGVEESEEEEILDDEEEEERPRAKRQRTAEPRDEGGDADADADADPDADGEDVAPTDHQRRGQRRVIDDDDEE